jgi:hypothetical protein
MNEILAYPPELLTKKHVAYMLSTSEWGVSDLVRQKKLIPVEDGGKWLKFRLTDVRDYIARLPEKKPS